MSDALSKLMEGYKPDNDKDDYEDVVLFLDGQNIAKSDADGAPLSLLVRVMAYSNRESGATAAYLAAKIKGKLNKPFDITARLEELSGFATMVGYAKNSNERADHLQKLREKRQEIEQQVSALNAAYATEACSAECSNNILLREALERIVRYCDKQMQVATENGMPPFDSRSKGYYEACAFIKRKAEQALAAAEPAQEGE